VPMDVVLGRERTQKTKVIKQADVVALLGLLPEEFAGDHADANFRYYEPRCGHGSSLSGAMHGLVAARPLAKVRRSRSSTTSAGARPLGTAQQLSAPCPICVFGQRGSPRHVGIFGICGEAPADRKDF
jgi:hypothetical protein